MRSEERDRRKCSASPAGSISSIQSIPSKCPSAERSEHRPRDVVAAQDAPLSAAVDRVIPLRRRQVPRGRYPGRSWVS